MSFRATALMFVVTVTLAVTGCAQRSVHGMAWSIIRAERSLIGRNDPTRAIVVIDGRSHKPTEIGPYCPRRQDPTPAESAREPACGLSTRISPPGPPVPVRAGEAIELRLSPVAQGLVAWIARRDFDVHAAPDVHVKQIATLPIDRGWGSRRWRIVVPDGVPRDGAMLRFEPAYRDWDNFNPASFALRVRPEGE